MKNSAILHVVLEDLGRDRQLHYWRKSQKDLNPELVFADIF